MKKFLATTVIALCLSGVMCISKTWAQDNIEPNKIQKNNVIRDEDAHIIVLNGTPDDVKKLIQSGYDVNKIYNCTTLLITAIKSTARSENSIEHPNYAVEKIKMLIDAKANVNAYSCPEKSMRPLAWAVTLPYQMNLSIDDANKALDEKIQNGTEYCEIPEIISKPCKDITSEEKLHISGIFEEGIHSAIKILMPSFMNVTEILIDNGADINGTDVEGQTTLHHAVIVPQDITLEPVKYLIAKGANINAQDIYGHTPLFLAHGSKNKEVVDLLIKAGADTNIRSHDGTAYDQIISQTKRGTINDNGILEVRTVQ